MINQSSEFELEESKSSLSFQRSVSQLLFNYLPDKVVDWEDGLAVVQLGTVRLKSAWDSRRAKLVIDAVDQYLSRWVNKEGLVKHPFPPRGEAERFAVGEPQAISATFFETALVCTNCDHLSFSDKRSLGREGKGRAARICPRCGKRSLRQFPHMFVHGCGRADPLSAWIPTFKIGDSGYEPSKKPLKCPVCGSRDYLKIPAKSERVRDIRIYCEKCGVQLPDRLTARCEDCVKELNGRKDTAEKNDNDGQQELTAVARVAMRMTRYSATDAYYAHTITILRTDGVPRFSDHSVTYKLLSEILAEGSPGQSAARELERLSVELQEASRRGDMTRVTALSQEISNMVSADHSKDMNDAERASSNIDLSDDVEDSVREYLSFRTTVKSTPVMTLTSKSLSNNVTQSVSSIMDYLGIAELSVIDDLPIITATMGYSRRSPNPTYVEPTFAPGRELSTTIRPFRPLDKRSVSTIDRPDLFGASPILAREAKHQGLFFSLVPERVIDWLQSNRVVVSGDQNALVRIIAGLEPIDRYYDDIWQTRIRRMVFGLVHSMSHAVMRAIGIYAGLERTSISEYVFLPGLGAVVYDNSSSTNLGSIETAVKNDLFAILDFLQDDAMNCIYDVDCIDKRTGACHGCIHSPEISCRVFNHGLSRAFLIGGHAPWSQSSSNESIRGFWMR